MRYYITNHETCHGLVAADDIPIGASVFKEITEEEYNRAIEKILLENEDYIGQTINEDTGNDRDN